MTIVFILYCDDISCFVIVIINIVKASLSIVTMVKIFPWHSSPLEISGASRNAWWCFLLLNMCSSPLEISEAHVCLEGVWLEHLCAWNIVCGWNVVCGWNIFDVRILEVVDKFWPLYICVFFLLVLFYLNSSFYYLLIYYTIFPYYILIYYTICNTYF